MRRLFLGFAVVEVLELGLAGNIFYFVFQLKLFQFECCR